LRGSFEVRERTEMAREFYGEHLTDVLPALGTHKEMTDI
jgi:hypothetical protein